MRPDSPPFDFLDSNNNCAATKHTFSSLVDLIINKSWQTKVSNFGDVVFSYEYITSCQVSVKEVLPL